MVAAVLSTKYQHIFRQVKSTGLMALILMALILMKNRFAETAEAVRRYRENGEISWL
jgi:hypothetical protein